MPFVNLTPVLLREIVSSTAEVQSSTTTYKNESSDRVPIPVLAVRVEFSAPRSGRQQLGRREWEATDLVSLLHVHPSKVSDAGDLGVVRCFEVVSSSDGSFRNCNNGDVSACSFASLPSSGFASHARKDSLNRAPFPAERHHVTMIRSVLPMIESGSGGAQTADAKEGGLAGAYEASSKGTHGRSR